jgi:4-amino-4-deoxy-L-arabinose transferase-like glycosyltransferase
MGQSPVGGMAAHGSTETRGGGVRPVDAPLTPIDRRIFVVAGGLFAFLMVLSARYGFHRDELYFLDGGRHLAASYVDQPIFSPLIARLSLELFGVSLTGLRLWPSLAAAGTVILGGLLAREFGGGRVAQLVGALGVATAPALLGADHILDTTPFDLLAWTALAWVVVRIGRTGDTRLWLAAGAVLGLGLTNKHSIAFFAIALCVGTAVSKGSAIFANRYFAVGAAIAALCALPDLWWQVANHWPTIGMTRALAQENGGLKNAIVFIPTQLVMASPVLVGVWLAGLRFLWRSERALWRGLAWSYGLLFVFFAFTTGAKPYYLAATYFFLIPAGAVALEQRWIGEPQRRRIQYVALAISFAVAALLTLPILPARQIGWTTGLDPVPTETVGWPELVQSVAGVWHALPESQRASSVIFTGNYGEAGAINELGRRDGLPEAVSGQNNVWYWGPGDTRATTIVAVVQGPLSGGAGQLVDQLRGDFAHVRVVATLHNRPGITNQEEGGHIYICTGPVRSWGALWPTFKFYS